MKTLYATCLSRLGLSQPEAAELHGVRLDTVKSWASGRRPVPAGAWEDLRTCEAHIRERSGMIRSQWEESGSPPVEIDDSEGDHLTRMAAADFVLGATGPVHVGQTAATLAARQARRLN